jgi:hypothetical protein
LIQQASFITRSLKLEGLEHFHGAAGDAVRLPQQQRAVLLLDDAGADVREGRQLRRQGQASGAAARR